MGLYFRIIKAWIYITITSFNDLYMPPLEPNFKVVGEYFSPWRNRSCFFETVFSSAQFTRKESVKYSTQPLLESGITFLSPMLAFNPLVLKKFPNPPTSSEIVKLHFVISGFERLRVSVYSVTWYLSVCLDARMHGNVLCNCRINVPCNVVSYLRNLYVVFRCPMYVRMQISANYNQVTQCLFQAKKA